MGVRAEMPFDLREWRSLTILLMFFPCLDMAVPTRGLMDDRPVCELAKVWPTELRQSMKGDAVQTNGNDLSGGSQYIDWLQDRRLT